MKTINEVQAALEAANERYMAAQQEGTRWTLMVLALAAREAFPTATAIILGQSDQGDFADVELIEVPEGAPVVNYDTKQDEFRDDHGTTAWNLSTSSWTEWQIFCDPDDNVRWQWRLLIDPVLEYEGDFTRYLADRQKEEQG